MIMTLRPFLDDRYADAASGDIGALRDLVDAVRGEIDRAQTALNTAADTAAADTQPGVEAASPGAAIAVGQAGTAAP